MPGSTASRESEPGPSADAPYETKAEPLPKNLGEALAALREDTLFAEKFGDGFVDYYCRIKEAEIARFQDAGEGRRSGGHALGAEGIFRFLLMPIVEAMPP